MVERPPQVILTITRFPYTTLFRPQGLMARGPAERLRMERVASTTVPRAPVSTAPPVGGVVRVAPATGWPGFNLPELWRRSEEHTSELQSLMRISYAVFCLNIQNTNTYQVVHHVLHHTITRHI